MARSCRGTGMGATSIPTCSGFPYKQKGDIHYLFWTKSTNTKDAFSPPPHCVTLAQRQDTSLSGILGGGDGWHQILSVTSLRH